MTTHPHYTDHLVSTPRRVSKPSDPDRLENRLRMLNPTDNDMHLEAADCIRDLARQLREVRGLLAAKDAELVTKTADRDRLATINGNLREYIEERWAEQDAHRTALRAIIYNTPKEQAA